MKKNKKVTPDTADLRFSGIWGPGEYFKEKSNEEINLIAEPLIKELQLTGRAVTNDSFFSPPDSKKAILEIQTLSPQGLEHLRRYLYYLSDKRREEILNYASQKMATLKSFNDYWGDDSQHFLKDLIIKIIKVPAGETLKLTANETNYLRSGTVDIQIVLRKINFNYQRITFEDTEGTLVVN